jgi:hypothetical protein
MNTEWITPQMVEMKLEEVAELANVDLACATNGTQDTWNDHM